MFISISLNFHDLRDHTPTPDDHVAREGAVGFKLNWAVSPRREGQRDRDMVFGVHDRLLLRAIRSDADILGRVARIRQPVPAAARLRR